MIDENNVQRARQDLLPPCKGDSVNYPMHEFFRTLKGDRLTISFEELGRTRADRGKYPKQLPPVAYKSLSWWIYNFGEDKHRASLAWLTAGWRIAELSRADEQVVFVRFKIPRIKFSVVSNSVPVQNANISFFYPNGTYLEAKTDALGDVYIDLNDKLTGKDKITLFCAKDGYEAFFERKTALWQEQKIDLKELSSGGSIICHGTCYIPNFTGRLNPILDASQRTYLYADNIAIEGGEAQPFYFKVSERFTIQDKDGKKIHLNIKAMIAGSSVLEYEFISPDVDMPESNPPVAFPSTDSEENQLIRLGHNNPPADKAITDIEETIRSIQGINEYIENRDEDLLTPMKTAVSSIKERVISNNDLRNVWDALKKAYKYFTEVVKLVDVVNKITNALSFLQGLF